jgi:putative DNA primase/helicase
VAISSAANNVEVPCRVVREVLEGSFCWASGLGWLGWDGARWQSTPDREVKEQVRQWAVRHYRTASRGATKALGRGDTATARALEALAKDWRITCSSGRLNAITGLASGIVLENGAAFDQQPDLLNCPNGVVDLRTGEIQPHDPALLFTKVAGCDYDPAATHPDWGKALQALPPEVQNWMQLRIGQAATGHAPDDDILPVCQGAGKNGKSTLFTGIARALGDFYTLVSDRVLLANPGDHPTELMELRGARFALIEETPEARKLDVQRMKKITGTTEITARLIAQNSVTFPVTHSMFITSNHRPMVEQTDHGTWRRLALVRFPFTFSGQNDDPGLRDRVKRDAAVQRAALAWIVRGARSWYASNRVTPNPPSVVAEDTGEWRAGSDLVLGYWGERLTPDPEAHIMATDLYADFTEWLEARGQRPWSERLLIDRFGEHQETERHRVMRKRIRRRDGLSRRFPGLTGDVAGQYWAVLRVRFQTETDQDAPPHTPSSSSSSVQAVQGSTGQSQVEALTRKTPGIPAHPTHALGFDLEQAS